MRKLIIAIDGHSACGKSTLARNLSNELGYAYIDTGAMYRAVTLFFLRHELNWDKPSDVQKALHAIDITFVHTEEGNRTILNGEDVEEEIRKMYISDKVSEVAAIPAVRRAMVQQQQTMGKDGGIILDGRDIGTVVFPNADLKLFLTASMEERANRRYKEMKDKGQSPDWEKIKENIVHRDRIDSNRADSPLRKANDAVTINNTELTKEEQLYRALQLVQAVAKKG